MLDITKITKINASKKTSTSVGGPPGVKINEEVRSQLAELIAPTPKTSSKKAVKWIVKKLGQKGAEEMAAGAGLTLKKYALSMYTEYLASKAMTKEALATTNSSTNAQVSMNDAMKALENGAEKRKLKKVAKQEEKAATEAEHRQKEIERTILQLRISTDETLKAALTAFLDGPLKDTLDAFVALYVSRKQDGDSDEAVLALDACRKAFDACGLLMVDVEVHGKKEKELTVKELARRANAAGAHVDFKLEKKNRKPKTSSDATFASMSKKTKVKINKQGEQILGDGLVTYPPEKPTKKVRKEMTPAQREAKNKKDRTRRAAAKKGGK